ncbi:MAG: HDOD domain-containing protein [Gammaproteobacteria bacterium]|nr:HDOD domain-containing protein [Gammaproteobacteria bacterium]MBU1414529.1 HDOD domain-containing protein [Gammaproteobacteria bacterium]
MEPPNDDKTGAALNAQRFQMLEDIAQELSGDVVFPTAFDVVTRLRKALQNPDLPLPRLAEIVEMEPLISGRLIGLANSVAFRRRGMEVRSVKVAVTRLGINLVRSTAMGISMNQLLRAKDLLPFRDIAQRLWQHSLHTAAAADVIAQRMTSIAPDEALLAGLVHDLGAFYMLYRASQYEELRTRPDTIRYLITEWHESIGHSLLIALGMPHAIADAMRDHDRPRPIPRPPRNLADVVYVANVLAGGKFEWLSRDSDAAAAETVELPIEFVDMKADIETREKEMRAIFG